MIETAAALIFAHFLADFVFQTDWIMARKRRPGGFAAHVAIVAFVSWACLGFALAPGALAAIALSHALIDAAKARLGGPGLTSFLADQAAHLVIALAVAQQVPGAYASGLWASGGPLAAHLPLGLLPDLYIIAAGLIAAVFAGGYAVAALMSTLDMEKVEGQLNVPRGGLYIGRLERLLIFMLVLTGNAGLIGFLIAAKSLLRFKEITREEDRSISEYVIIGTLASFAWGLAASQVTSFALALP